ncbi:CinA family protein [Aurantiacibacter poecillastricola]|uniref:CinA family protein n=1 Tax=Aurantiacibacter poecillastricola TaxID=3064385 RepID=UPI00273F337F|nr:CinA family protein [Aurantiacibacter sp. 219JJ12-13]MDP5261696.1 CinA family protein [Aurantiacibacter sp. 219JJ12-13]
MELRSSPRVDVVWRDTMLVTKIAEPTELHDPAALAQELLDEAYRSDLNLASAECFSGGTIAAKFGGSERNRSHLAGAFIFNSEHAIAQLLGRNPADIRQADPDSLAADMALAAMRATGASLALGIVAPRGIMRFGPVSFSAMDERGNKWEERPSANDLPEREIAGQAIAFFKRCLRSSLERHL